MKTTQTIQIQKQVLGSKSSRFTYPSTETLLIIQFVVLFGRS